MQPRSRRRGVTRVGLLALAAMLIAGETAAAAPYTFSEIAQTDAYPGQQFYIVTGPAINESGTVAFRQISGGAEGIYTRSPGGLIVPVATTAGGVFAGFGPNPDINDSGTVVFHAIPRAGGEGLARRAGAHGGGHLPGLLDLRHRPLWPARRRLPLD